METGIDIGRRHVNEIEEKIISHEITALVCFNDILAIGALLGCRDLGIAVPKECSIVGFDGLAVAAFTTPVLTTIRQPREKIGRHAVKLILSHIDAEVEQIKNYLGNANIKSQPFMKPEFITGGSTAMVYEI